jgi:hypothetical protein
MSDSSSTRENCALALDVAHLPEVPPRQDGQRLAQGNQLGNLGIAEERLREDVDVAGGARRVVRSLEPGPLEGI